MSMVFTIFIPIVIVCLEVEPKIMINGTMCLEVVPAVLTVKSVKVWSGPFGDTTASTLTRVSAKTVKDIKLKPF